MSPMLLIIVKITSNYDVLALLNLQLFLFQAENNNVKICLEQMFMTGSNIREAADLKDVIATGKRSQVTRLVYGPLLVILSIGNQ